MSRLGSSGADTTQLDVRGLRVSMRVSGEGPPLLLVNGVTRRLQSWDAFAERLDRRTVIAFDAPGVGASATPPLPLSISALAAVAVAVLDAAGVDDADVLGFSHGGAVAQQLAFDAPQRVRGLVLAATSCGVGATPGHWTAAARGLRTPGAGDAWQGIDPVGLLWHSLAFSSWSSIPFLGGIEAPTLVVCGTHDRVSPPVNSRILARRIPGAALVLLPAGHDLQRVEPAAALARAVDSFLTAAPPAELRPAAGGTPSSSRNGHDHD